MHLSELEIWSLEEARDGGFCSEGHSVLDDLSDKGLLSDHPGWNRERVYRLTEAGYRVVESLEHIRKSMSGTKHSALYKVFMRHQKSLSAGPCFFPEPESNRFANHLYGNMVNDLLYLYGRTLLTLKDIGVLDTETR